MKSFITEEKADLHVHLEGTVSQKRLCSLAEKNNISLNSPVHFPGGFNAVPPQNIGKELPTFGNFIDFIGCYAKITQCISDADDIIDIAKDYAALAKAENVTYAELYFSPSTYIALKKEISPLFEGLAEAERLVKRDYGIELRWIFDIVRNSPSDPLETISLALDARKRNVSVEAIGLAGYEIGFPAAFYKDAFVYAREKGFTILAHAGELLGAESVWDAIHACNPKRIGHGVSALKDSSLVDYLRDNQIPIEVSPWSNIALGVTDEKNHPIKQMVDAQLNVIISSDDPGIFGKSLNDNYILAHCLGISEAILLEIAKKSLSPSLRATFTA